ncbi:hypothetical protein SUBVAR_07056 [Subdoligranulum variabile DSM 15176]|uniref:Uncharacterized protein n=1 Tax=Subdoligranulum variabile DSM 15176 TaxID=411471 RepID=D1PRP8_9FIRM|nr:hypothetical protein SUBVAR_07056 [Subdoligranulum variabile DSM 15176]
MTPPEKQRQSPIPTAGMNPRPTTKIQVCFYTKKAWSYDHAFLVKISLVLSL